MRFFSVANYPKTPQWCIPVCENIDDVNVLFAVDENYVPFFTVAFASLIAHVNRKRRYNIFILHKGLDKQNQTVISAMYRRKQNINLRFLDIEQSGIKNIAWRENKYLPHTSGATYLRMHVYDIFKEIPKILYLDCDVVILDDIGKLYDFDLKDAWLAAAKDVRESIAGRYNIPKCGKNWTEYIKDELLIIDPDSYFQAGILLFNTSKGLTLGAKEQIFKEYIRLKDPLLVDQDILNAACTGHVRYFPIKWNVQWQIPLEFASYRDMLDDDREEYENAYSKPAIIHYASPLKPWNYNGWATHAHHFWKYARKSPYKKEFGWKTCSILGSFYCKIRSSRRFQTILNKVCRFFPKKISRH